MIENAASRTALGVAYMRAAHQLLDGKPLLFPDPIALALLGPDAPDQIRDSLSRHQTPFWRGMRSHVCLRSRFAEDKLAEAVERGTSRYVLVGAGYDTFAFRQPDWARALKIVEVDHPATQAAKQEMLATAGIALPENLTFLAADFTREALPDMLARLKIQPGDGVYFSWLGVSMYLEQAAVDATLAAMADAARKVSVCLSFKQPTNGNITQDVQFAEAVASVGEPFLSLFTPKEMADKLAAHGFARQDFLTSEKARADYFTPPRRGIPAPHNTTIVLASK
jgi:methyltransferase (TIGR00027 family)